MAASSALPGLVFCFCAMVQLVVVSLSTPVWDEISFMNVEDIGFGIFGFTGSETRFGYDFPIPAASHTTAILHNLTFALILYPIAAGLSGISVLLGLCGASCHRSGTVFMCFTTTASLLCTLAAWVTSTVLFAIVCAGYRDIDYNATWGNATWIGFGALVSLFLGFIATAWGIFGEYRRATRLIPFSS
ncbi:hypothetical protein ID866_7626 [Astraeus odoratus]|nr:hypothetical protein ID866_7626 [Astraeus odoratus]